MTSERGNRLSGKVAVVTGAGATGSGDFVGIGQAISILFARQGAKVLLVDREERNAQTTLAMIREEGGEASIFAGDVTSNDDCRDMADAAKSRYGNVNVLINNVGISGPGSVTDVDVDFWDTVMDVNLKSVMLCSKHAIPQMIEDGGGSIVNLSSIVGLRAGSGRASHPYAASKGGIIGLSNSMAVHYGRDNVRVNCIAPGHVHSPMVARHTSQEMLDLRRRAGAAGSRGHAVGRSLRGALPGFRRVAVGVRSNASGGRRAAGRHAAGNVPLPARRRVGVRDRRTRKNAPAAEAGALGFPEEAMSSPPGGYPW